MALRSYNDTVVFFGGEKDVYVKLILALCLAPTLKSNLNDHKAHLQSLNLFEN